MKCHGLIDIPTVVRIIFHWSNYFTYSATMVEDLISHSLIYGKDIHHGNTPLYCEFVTKEQFQSSDGSNHIVKECFEQNKKMILRRDNKNYYPYFGYTGGKNGLLLACDKPQNVTLHNCTNGNLIYSKCNYTCTGGLEPKLSFIECHLQGPLSDINATFANVPLCINKDKTVGEEVSSKSSVTENVIIPTVVLSILGVIVLVLWLIYKKKKETHSTSITDGIKDEEKGDPAREGLINNNCQDLSHIQGNGGPADDAQHEKDVLTRKGDDRQQCAMGELTFNQRCSGSVAFHPYRDSRDADSLFNKIQESFSLGSLDGDSKNVGNKEDCLAQADGAKKEEDKCSTSVNVLLNGDPEFIKRLWELTEFIDGQDEENTFKGLARKIRQSINIKDDRGVDVYQAQPEISLGDSRPCIGFLRRMAEHDIKVGVLIDYFDEKKIIELILEVHKDCSCCSKLAAIKLLR